MGMDTKGDAGTYRRMTMDDAFWVVGTTPNTSFGARVESTGKEIKRFDMSGTAGVVEGVSALPRYEEIDNSSDHHGGQLSLVAMNAFCVDAGGGINLSTASNVALLAGHLINMVAPDQISMAGNMVSVTALNTVFIETKQVYVDSPKTVFAGNVQFGKNVMVNGGMFVNGELFVNHISCQKQTNFTGGAMMGTGNGLAVFPAVGVWSFTVVTPIPVEGGGVITTGTPVTLTPVPGTFTVGHVVPHIHSYTGPACSSYDSMTDFFEAAADVEKTEPVEAKPTLPGDMTTQELIKKIRKDVTKAVKNYMKKQLGIGGGEDGTDSGSTPSGGS